MLNKVWKLGFLMIFAGFLSACSASQFYHEKIMRGQIVGIDNDEVVLCVGSIDGAMIGQEMQVYRYVWVGAEEDGDDDYQVSHVGTLKVKSVVNEHFSRAIRIKGDIRKNDMIELKNSEI